jgi:undecaprenyl-diphosphatase
VTGRPASVVLPPSLRVWLGPVAALAALVAVVLGVLHAGDSGPGRVDARIGAAVEGAAPPWRDVAPATDFLGEPVGAATLVLATAAVCPLLRRPRAAVLAVAGTGLAVGATTLLKPLVGRTIHDGYLSYPSGHTAFLTALALVVALFATGRLGLGRAAGTSLVLVAALVAGTAMGWAQVTLGAHYPTDALGGWCTALAVVPATAWLVGRLADRTADRTTDRPADPVAAYGAVTPPGAPAARRPPGNSRCRRRGGELDRAMGDAWSTFEKGVHPRRDQSRTVPVPSHEEPSASGLATTDAELPGPRPRRRQRVSSSHWSSRTSAGSPGSAAPPWRDCSVQMTLPARV